MRPCDGSASREPRSPPKQLECVVPTSGASALEYPQQAHWLEQPGSLDSSGVDRLGPSEASENLTNRCVMMQRFPRDGVRDKKGGCVAVEWRR
jgi:hypothetical protein